MAKVFLPEIPPTDEYYSTGGSFRQYEFNQTQAGNINIGNGLTP